MLGLNSQSGNLIMPEIIGVISKLAGRSVAAPACPCSALSCLSHQQGPSRRLPALHSKTGFCSHLLSSHLPKLSPVPGWKRWGRESTHCISCPLKHCRSRCYFKSQSYFLQSIFFLYPTLSAHSPTFKQREEEDEILWYWLCFTYLTGKYKTGP